MGRKNYSTGIFLILLLIFNTQVFSQRNPYRADKESPRQIRGMKLVWSDEFNVDGKPNPAFWKYENGFARNEELQWYQPENAFCKDGLLVIEARRDTIPNPNFVEGSSDWRKNRKYAYYSSASIKTPALVEYQFGRIEVRARVDTTKGSWPAIWTLGTSGRWPFCGEVDLMEFYRVAGVPTILANVAWGSSTNRGGTWNSMKTPLSHFLAKDPDWPRKFHVWRMDWNKDSICLYLDDELLNFTSLNRTINPMAPPVNPFLQKHYFLLNLAIGANGGNPEHSKFPFKYEVDYIRIYQNTASETRESNNGQALISGKPIRVTTRDHTGLFPLPSINGTPLACVFLGKDKMPTLFLASDKWRPGIYRYPCVKYENGVPVFGDGTRLNMPARIGEELPSSTFQHNGKLYFFWLKGDSILETTFAEDKNTFTVHRGFAVKGLPRKGRSIAVTLKDGNLFGYVEIDDGVPVNGPVHWENKNFPPYTAEGMFVGNLTYAGLYGFKISFEAPSDEVEARPLTSLNEVMWGYQKIIPLEYLNDVKGLLTGSQNGNFLFYRFDGDHLNLSKKVFATGEDGIAIRHNTIWARPVSVTNMSGKHTGLIVSGEGGIFFYKYVSFKNGKPVYANAQPLLAISPELYGGSLVVPNLVDWDGDGDLDLVFGNSIGNVSFIENKGTNSAPVFCTPVKLKAGGKEIHIQPGYKDDIQGPGEARWGYTCPTVTDWNNDGLPDILMNDSRGKHRLFLNTGTKRKPVLEPESPMYVDGLELYGTWRTRPAAGELNHRMVYITQDKDDQFHMYRQIDTYNLEDAGKLKLSDGKYINGSYFGKGGGTGRTKFLLVDWDGDGTKDLIVGTPRFGSVPDNNNGMPYHHGNKGAAVLFLKNAGSEAAPVFDYPKMLRYKGQTIHFGQHSCAPTVGNLGKDNGLDLVVGTENGRFYFYEREDLSW